MLSLYYVYHFVISLFLIVATIHFVRGMLLAKEHGKLARLLLWLFILCNIAGEYVAFYFYLYLPDASNEFVYSYSIMLHVPALFAFYSLAAKKMLLHTAGIIGWILMFIVFFINDYWRPGVNLHVFHVAGYYLIMATVSLMFLWYNFKEKEARKNKFVISLGAMFSIYFAIAFTLIPVNFIFENYAGRSFFVYATTVLNVSYYSIFTIILFLNLKKRNQDAPGIL